MKKRMFVVIALALISASLVCADTLPRLFRGAQSESLSVSPITLTGLVMTPSETSNPIDFLWFGIDYNSQFTAHKETSFGLYMRGLNYAAFRAQWRTYSNENHSGFFYGLYGALEYRKLYWGYTESGDMIVQSFIGNEIGDNLYHGAGLNLGGDAGFRIRGKRMGVTLYASAGVPLLYYFGSTLPGQDELGDFYLLNVLPKALSVGLKIDLYN
jgi:hypothetical protein